MSTLKTSMQDSTRELGRICLENCEITGHSLIASYAQKSLFLVILLINLQFPVLIPKDKKKM